MLKSFLSSIVGDDTPSPTPSPAKSSPARPGMPMGPGIDSGRPPSRPPSQPASGRSSPLSESGSGFFGSLLSSTRRGSSSSLHSHASSTVDEPDLSHLSAEERAQIEAVIARAREMQEEGDQRVRDIEKDFGDSPNANAQLPGSVVAKQPTSVLNQEKPAEKMPPKVHTMVKAPYEEDKELSEKEQSVTPPNKSVTSHDTRETKIHVTNGGKIHQPNDRDKCSDTDKGLVTQLPEKASKLPTDTHPGIGYKDKGFTSRTTVQGDSSLKSDAKSRPTLEAQPITQQLTQITLQKGASKPPPPPPPISVSLQEPVSVLQSTWRSSVAVVTHGTQGGVQQRTIKQQSYSDIVQPQTSHQTVKSTSQEPPLQPSPNRQQHTLARPQLQSRHGPSVPNICEQEMMGSDRTKHQPPSQAISGLGSQAVKTDVRAGVKATQDTTRGNQSECSHCARKGLQGSELCVPCVSCRAFVCRFCSANINKGPQKDPEWWCVKCLKQKHDPQGKQPLPVRSDSQATQKSSTSSQDGTSSGILESKAVADSKVQEKQDEQQKKPDDRPFQQTFPMLTPKHRVRMQRTSSLDPGHGPLPQTQQDAMGEADMKRASFDMSASDDRESEVLSPEQGKTPRPSNLDISQKAPAQYQAGQQDTISQSQSQVHQSKHRDPVKDQSITTQPTEKSKQEIRAHEIQDRHSIQQTHVDYTRTDSNNSEAHEVPKPASKRPDWAESSVPHHTNSTQHLMTSQYGRSRLDAHKIGMVHHGDTEIHDTTTNRKSKPSPLDRMGGHSRSFEEHKANQQQTPPGKRTSPSRVSPRSPPRSPSSWLRHRESPPCSPASLHHISPTKSPTEKFPTHFTDLPYTSGVVSSGVTWDKHGIHYAEGQQEFVFPERQQGLAEKHDRHHEVSDRPPPKPARSSLSGNNASHQTGSAGNEGSGSTFLDTSLDLASYAATIASNTAHLTSMSVSPTNQIIHPGDPGSVHEDVHMLDDSSNSSYYDDDEDRTASGDDVSEPELDISDPSEKHIDFGNTVRQKVKPPASDWSPVTDLSPILDVSPSLEFIEQQKMLAEQEAVTPGTRDDELLDSGLYSSSSCDYETTHPARHSPRQGATRDSTQPPPTTTSPRHPVSQEQTIRPQAPVIPHQKHPEHYFRGDQYKHTTGSQERQYKTEEGFSMGPRDSDGNIGASLRGQPPRTPSPRQRKEPVNVTSKLGTTDSSTDPSLRTASLQSNTVSSGVNKTLGTASQQQTEPIERVGAQIKQLVGNRLLSYQSSSDRGAESGGVSSRGFSPAAEPDSNLTGSSPSKRNVQVTNMFPSTHVQGSELMESEQVGARASPNNNIGDCYARGDRFGNTALGDTGKGATAKFEDSGEGRVRLSSHYGDYDSDESAEEYDTHHSFEGDPEIDLDDDIPLQKRTISIDRTKLINDRFSPGPLYGDDEQDTPFERQGGLVRSKVRFFSQSSTDGDTRSSSNKREDTSETSGAPTHSRSDNDMKRAGGYDMEPEASTQSPTISFIEHARSSTSPRSTLLSQAQTTKQSGAEEGSYAQTQDKDTQSDEQSGSLTTDRILSPTKRLTSSVHAQDIAQHTHKPGRRITRSNSLDTTQLDKDSEKKSKRRLPPVPSLEDMRSGVTSLAAYKTTPTSSTPKLSDSPTLSSTKTTTEQSPSPRPDKELLRVRLKQMEAERAAGNGNATGSNGKNGKTQITNGLNGGQSVSTVTSTSPQPKVTITTTLSANMDTKSKSIETTSVTSSPAKAVPPKKLPKPTLATKPKPSVTTKPIQQTVVKPPVSKKPVETVNVYGIDVPVDVRSMKKRIKEEIQIVTATRRLKIDEMEEVRMMERELAERERRRRADNEQQARAKARQRAQEERERERLRKLEQELRRQRDQERQLDAERLQAEESLRLHSLAQNEERLLKQQQKSGLSASSSGVVASADSLLVSSSHMTGSTSKMADTIHISPISPRKQTTMTTLRHRRQNSDPILAFSPIEETKDFVTEETIAAYRLGAEARKLGSSLSNPYASPQPMRRNIRLGAATPTDMAWLYGAGERSMDPSMYGGFPLRPSGRSKSSEVLCMVDREENRVGILPADEFFSVNTPLSRTAKSKSQYSGIGALQEESLALGESPASQHEKRALLQQEIEKRRAAMEENARLRREIEALAHAANIAPYEFALAKSKYEEHMAAQKQQQQQLQQQQQQQQHQQQHKQMGPYATLPHKADSRIIRPLDHDLAQLHAAAVMQSRGVPQLPPHSAVQHYMESMEAHIPAPSLYTTQRSPVVGPTSVSHNSYSSTEYLSHRGDPSRPISTSVYETPTAAALRAHSEYYNTIGARGMIGQSHPYTTQNALLYQQAVAQVISPPLSVAHDNRRAQFYMGDERSDEDLLDSATRGRVRGYPAVSAQDHVPKMSLPHRRQDMEYYGLISMAGGSADAQSETSIATDTTMTSVKDATPSMPILDDVTVRSRSQLRKIGSRPLSDDFGELMAERLAHAESEQSVAESDDHIMEGGVTIRERRDIRRLGMDTSKRGSYEFPTKCILLTKDPKERSVQGRKHGNGIGMKIVGGKIIPGTNEVGAYVSAIYPGGVADQLHGELQEGDQVLEWNGVSLTSKTYEEVQHIISQPNGEIELVVRPDTRLSHKDQTMSTLSAHSSYDNLAIDSTTSDYEDFDGRMLDCLVAAQKQRNRQQQQQQQHPHEAASLERAADCAPPHQQHSPNKQTGVPTSQTSPFKTIARGENKTGQSNSTVSPNRGPASQFQNASPKKHTANSGGEQTQKPPGYTEHHMSPGASPSSSPSPADPTHGGTGAFLTSMSPNASLSGTSTQSDHQSLIELPALGADPENWNRDPHDWGKLQLQLSYDDYDGTLNIHVMQARGLKPKDRNGLSDPFVKCYLLPGRIGENKRRTKIIQKSLDPEWHQTLVFMKISKDELKSKTLELTIWDYDRFKPNDFLGAVYLDLGASEILDNRPHWYKLHEYDSRMAVALSKAVPFSPSNATTRNPLAKLEGYSRPIDEPKHPGTVESPPYAMKQVVPSKDMRTLHVKKQPEHSGAKYSPGLGRRKDNIKQDRINKRTSDEFTTFS